MNHCVQRLAMFEKCATGYPICRSAASNGIKLISKYRRETKKRVRIIFNAS